MKKHFLIILTIIILIPFMGCKKYPEGHNLSFRSAVKRISGVWEVETFYVNDINLTIMTLELNWKKEINLIIILILMFLCGFISPAFTQTEEQKNHEKY